MVRMFETHSPRSRRSRQARVPRLELLETRNLLSTFTVTNVNDSGAGSLAQAITDANNTPLIGSVPNTIAFNIPGAGLHKIALQNALPAITNAVVLNGYTQPGAHANTNPIDQPDNAVLDIQIQGTPQIFPGLLVGPGGGGSTIEGLDITGFSQTTVAGIELSATAGGNHVVGNFIGTDPTGMLSTQTLTNYYGVDVEGPNNVIGGTAASDRNVISGNRTYGVLVNGSAATNTSIEGNYIGLTADGNSAFAPGSGYAEGAVFVNQADQTFIGGAGGGQRNVVAGFDSIGLSKATNTTIQGNFIGTDRTGTAPVSSLKGITVTNCQNTIIGGTTPGSGNVMGTTAIANAIGVQIDLSATTTIEGNFIGTDVTQTHNTGPFQFGVDVQRSTNTTIGGTAPGAGNVIANGTDAGAGCSVYIPITGGAINDVLMEGNSFYGNDGPAIVGSNTLFPFLTGATATTITGHISGTAGSTYRVEYFATPNTGGASSHQAKTLIGVQDNLVADPGGNVPLSFSPVGGVPAGQFITATATRDGVSTSGVGGGIVVTAGSSAALGVNVAAPATVAPGGTITYTINVGNAGPDAALQSKLTTAVPAGTTLVSFVAPSGWNVSAPAVGGTGPINASIASVPNGAKAVFTLVVKTSAGAAGGSTIPMACSASTTTSDPNPAGESASASTTVVATPTLVATKTSVVGSPNPSTVGQPVALVATVTGTSGTPAGSVTFKDGATTLGVVPLDKTGHAVLGTSSLSAGTHQITALYSGNPTFAPSQGTTSQAVVKSLVRTQTVVASTVNPALAGQAVTFVASVTGTGGVPSGKVTFTDGSSVLGVAALDATGHAALTVSTFSVGNHPITAIYGGDANCVGSQGAMSQAVISAQGAGPQITRLQRFGYHWMPTVVVLAVDSPLDPVSAQNRANYRITGPGGRSIAISSVVYNPTAQTVTIYPSERLNIHWNYLLQVNGSTPTGVRGADGALLNAAGVGLPGHDYQALVTFSSVVFG